MKSQLKRLRPDVTSPVKKKPSASQRSSNQTAATERFQKSLMETQLRTEADRKALEMSPDDRLQGDYRLQTCNTNRLIDRVANTELILKHTEITCGDMPSIHRDPTFDLQGDLLIALVITYPSYKQLGFCSSNCRLRCSRFDS